MAFIVVFTNNNFSSCFLILAVMTQILDPTAELEITIRKPTNKEKEKIESDRLVAQAKISNRSI